jgi:hypothetical protein
MGPESGHTTQQRYRSNIHSDRMSPHRFPSFGEGSESVHITQKGRRTNSHCSGSSENWLHSPRIKINWSEWTTSRLHHSEWAQHRSASLRIHTECTQNALTALTQTYNRLHPLRMALHRSKTTPNRFEVLRMGLDGVYSTQNIQSRWEQRSESRRGTQNA